MTADELVRRLALQLERVLLRWGPVPVPSALAWERLL